MASTLKSFNLLVVTRKGAEHYKINAIGLNPGLKVHSRWWERFDENRTACKLSLDLETRYTTSEL